MTRSREPSLFFLPVIANLDRPVEPVAIASLFPALPAGPDRVAWRFLRTVGFAAMVAGHRVWIRLVGSCVCRLLAGLRVAATATTTAHTETGPAATSTPHLSIGVVGLHEQGNAHHCS